MAKWRKARDNSTVRRAKQTELDRQKAYANELIEDDRPEEAMEILDLLELEYPNDFEIKVLLGICHLGQGDPLTAVQAFEAAYAMGRNPAIWYPLGTAYLEATMPASALHAFTESERNGLILPEDIQPALVELRLYMEEAASERNLPVHKTSAGMRDLERGNYFLALGDNAQAITAYRNAIRQFGAWPPPHNSLSLALFFDGQSAAAIHECRQILAQHPEELLAATSLIRFLAWSGDRVAADSIWQEMRRRIPIELPGDALLLAQAAGVMEDDEAVQWLLAPLADWTEDQFDLPLQYQQAQLFLAIAEANLGDPEAARERLEDLDLDDEDHTVLVLEALDDEMPSLGLADRFSYYLGAELLPLHLEAEIMSLIFVVGESNDPQAEKDFKRIVARYPQLVLMAEKLVWEEDDIAFGLLMLRCIGTPAAHAALRRFALGQLGSDEERMAALLNLQAGGGVQPGERFMMWIDDAWESVQPPNFRIGARHDQSQIRPKVAKLIEEGLNALGEGRSEEAETLFRQVIALEPKALTAYNNLASLLRADGDTTASRALLEQALAVNPNYFYARVNLALMAMDEDVEAAVAHLAPLAAVTDFTADEFAFYQYTLAQLAVRQNDIDNARRQLAIGLAINPDYEPSLDLLSTLEVEETPSLSGFDHKTLADLAKNFADNLRKLQGKD